MNWGTKDFFQMLFVIYLCAGKEKKREIKFSVALTDLQLWYRTSCFMFLGNVLEREWISAFMHIFQPSCQ